VYNELKGYVTILTQQRRIVNTEIETIFLKLNYLYNNTKEATTTKVIGTNMQL
jgi:hypothetical protein